MTCHADAEMRKLGCGLDVSHKVDAVLKAGIRRYPILSTARRV